MAPEKLNDYERRRLENIRRNDEMMAALRIHSKATELSSTFKRQRTESKSYKLNPENKPKKKTPIVIRQSLRKRGITPDYADGIKDELAEPKIKIRKPPIKPPPPPPRPLNMKDAYKGTGSDQALLETIGSVLKKSRMGFIMKCSNDVKLSVLVDEIDGDSCNLIKYVSENETSNCAVMSEGKRVTGSVDLRSFSLEPENIARVMPERISSLKFFPSTNVNMMVAGNVFGNVAFWDVDSRKEEGDGIYLYHPHSGPVSGVSIQPFALSKIFTSCHGGFIRLMDAEKEMFDLLYCSNEAIFCLSQHPNDTECLYFGEGHGGLNIWDERAGKSSSSWLLHEDRINSIDFNSENPNIMVTSSSDGTACIWDLRSIDADMSKTLKTVNHERAVHSAYFSPSGSCIATTSVDNTIGILNGVNYEDESMIDHDNPATTLCFRGIWGWDDSHVFIGNTNKAVDVVAPARRRTIMTLESEHMFAIPYRLDAHPYKVGMLAGATSGGHIYLWTSSS